MTPPWGAKFGSVREFYRLARIIHVGRNESA
jgi:hypothetical protein